MPKKFSYKAILVKGPMNGVYAEFPFDSRQEFGTSKHIWSKVTVEGISSPALCRQGLTFIE
ncbi:MAG: hypothetical protein ACK5HT_13920 [Draconibacterium sp.]